MRVLVDGHLRALARSVVQEQVPDAISRRVDLGFEREGVASEIDIIDRIAVGVVNSQSAHTTRRDTTAMARTSPLRFVKNM